MYSIPSIHHRPGSGSHYSKGQYAKSHIHRRSQSLEKRNHHNDSARSYHNDHSARTPDLTDANCQPVNYSGTQVNIFGQPNSDSLNSILGYTGGNTVLGGGGGGGGGYPYGMAYPPAGYTNNVQLGLMTEHMLRKLDESRMFTVTELMRRAYGPPTTPYVQEPPSPREAIEYRPKAKQFSPGNGDWKGQIDHIYAHLLEIASENRQFRANIGEPVFGEIIQADLEEDGTSYTLKINFAKTKDAQDRYHHHHRHGNVEDKKIRFAPEHHERRRSRSSSPVQKSFSIIEDKKTESKVKQEIDREPQYEKENYRQEGTLKPYKNFNAETDADALKKAMKGLGTDENAIINIFGKRSSKQRQEIVKQYKTMFGKDLLKDLKSELSGNFDKVIRALCLPHADFDATELRNAIKGLGTNDSCLIEIICTRTNKTLKSIQESYKRLYNKSLEQDIMDDTSGHYQRLLVSLLQSNRDETDQVDRHQAKKDAQMLFEAGPKHWGTDESKFNAILVSRSYAQLRATFREFEKLTKKPMEETISSELSGDLGQGMLTIVQCVQNKPRYFATRLYKSMKGMGTDDASLIRIVVSRCEVDMIQIKDEFEKNFKKPLGQFIADDTSGDYAAILLALIGESNSLPKKEKHSSSGRHSSSRSRHADDSDD